MGRLGRRRGARDFREIALFGIQRFPVLKRYSEDAI